MWLAMTEVQPDPVQSRCLLTSHKRGRCRDVWPRLSRVRSHCHAGHAIRGPDPEPRGLATRPGHFANLRRSPDWTRRWPVCSSHGRLGLQSFVDCELLLGQTARPWRRWWPRQDSRRDQLLGSAKHRRSSERHASTSLPFRTLRGARRGST